MIGCACAVCTSSRSARSAHAAVGLLDAAGRHRHPDRHVARSARSRRCAIGLPRVDAVLFTHGHADHVLGLDDMRRFNAMQDGRIPCYGDPQTIARSAGHFRTSSIRRRRPAAVCPRSISHAVDGALRASAAAAIIPVPLWHGQRLLLRLSDRIARLPDRLQRDPRRARGPLHRRRRGARARRAAPPSASHALQLSRGARRRLHRLGPRSAWFTHICHDLPHAATNASLPPQCNWHMMVCRSTSASADRMDPGRRPAPRPVDVIHFPDDPRPPRWQHPVLALGNFDGLHRGHIKIIERVRRVATERGATAVVMTFDPHPPRVVRPDKAPPLLMTKAQRLEAIERAGVDGVAVVRFTPELSRWDPETFVRTVLVEWLHVAEVWVGANFLFGHDRAGNFSMLRSARRALRVPRREDRPGPLQGFRRQQHAHPAADQRGPRRRGRRAARPSVLDRRHRGDRRSAGPQHRVSRPPTWPPRTS